MVTNFLSGTTDKSHSPDSRVNTEGLSLTFLRPHARREKRVCVLHYRQQYYSKIAVGQVPVFVCFHPIPVHSGHPGLYRVGSYVIKSPEDRLKRWVAHERQR